MRSALHNRSWLFALLVATFFICARAGSIAHAANYGTAPHNHDSKICLFSVLADEEQDDLALPPVGFSITQPSPVFTFLYSPIHKVSPEQVIATTARAPPGQ